MSYILRMKRNKKCHYPNDSLLASSTGRVTVYRRCGKRGGRPQRALKNQRPYLLDVGGTKHGNEKHHPPSQERHARYPRKQ